MAVKPSNKPKNKNYSTGKSLGMVLVTYGNEKSLPELLTRIIAEKAEDDFIVLIDNHPKHGCARIAESTTGIDVVIRSSNIGFSEGCNRGVKELPISIKLILCINPDVLPEPNAISKLRNGGKPEWGAWMGLLTIQNQLINSAGNIVHISGLSWCGNYGDPISSARGKRLVTAVSGACCVIRKEVWDKLGGFAEVYFMYYEDTDFSFSMLRTGLKLGIVPNARFEHDYTFNKSPQKWFYLERNRYIFIVRQWPLMVIVMLLPVLIFSEIGLWAISLLQGRVLLRFKALTSFFIILPKLIMERHKLQRQTVISSKQFFSYLQPMLTSPLLGLIAGSKLTNSLLATYYRVAGYVISAIYLVKS
jgi:GT2 family glycosyltransferase